MNHIIESIGSWGVTTTPARIRLNRVGAGDIVELPESLRGYPCSHKLSRIASIDENGMASICEGMGSAFLLPSGECDISGGPWWGVPIQYLQPTGRTHQAHYWNWGDNSPGAAQGVDYYIDRPVHVLTLHPEHCKTRYAVTEADARNGKYSHDRQLGEEWTIHRQSEADHGETCYVFVNLTPYAPRTPQDKDTTTC